MLWQMKRHARTSLIEIVTMGELYPSATFSHGGELNRKSLTTLVVNKDRFV